MICQGAVSRCMISDSANGSNMRRLQRRHVERCDDRGDLGFAEYPQIARQLAVEGFHRLARLQHRADRRQIFDHVRRADAGQRALLVVAGHRRHELTIACAAASWKLRDSGFDGGGHAGLAGRRQRGLELARGFRRAVAGQPLPDRRQRGAADLRRPDREIAVDQKRLERTEQQPRRIVGARKRLVVLVFGAAHDLAQLLEHEGRNHRVFAALQRALELPHQQRLRLRRKLREILPQTLGRCLAHAPGMHGKVVGGRQACPPGIIKARALRSR